MNFDLWAKKEKPFATMIGMGGGATSLVNTAGGGGSGIVATGGIIGEYVDGAGDAYKCHVFTSSGVFAVTEVNGDGEIEYLCVGGGGGGGSVTGSGGGGGGFRTNMAGNPLSADNPIVVTGPSNIPITIGHGGKAGSLDPYSSGWTKGHNGGPSIFGHPTSPITSAGGGGGKGYDPSPTAASGDGGSGGGGNGGGPGGPAGSGNTPPVTPVQGYDGGPGSSKGTGGGGGAGGQGGTGSPNDRGGIGGLGQPLTIEGDIYTVPPSPGVGAYAAKNSSYAPGGSGGTWANYPSSTPTIPVPINGGESGYGPTSEGWSTRKGLAGVSGFGGGGGGCGQNSEGAAGGSGVIVVRYKTGSMTATAKATGGIVNFYPGSPLSPTGATIHIFRASGTFTMPGSFNENIEWWMIGGGGSGGGNIGGGGGSGQFKTGTGSFSGPATCRVDIGRGGYATGPSPSNSGWSSRKGGNSGINLPGSPATSIPSAWQTAGGGGGGGFNQDPKENGEDGSAIGGPEYRGSGGGGCGGPAHGSGGVGQPGPFANPNPTTTWGSNPGGSGSPNDDGGGGGGAGGGGGTPAGGAGVQLPATFRNPEMIGTPNPSYGAPGGAGGGGGLGYPGPGGGWFWFGGGGNGGQFPSGYGSWGGGAGGAWYGSKPIMMSTGYAGGGNSTGPDNTKSPPGTNPALGDGGAGGVNSGGGGGGTCKCGPSFPSPDDPAGGYYFGGNGGTGIVLVAYPQ